MSSDYVNHVLLILPADVSPIWNKRDVIGTFFFFFEFGLCMSWYCQQLSVTTYAWFQAHNVDY